MKVLCVVHMYVPIHNAGAEWMQHAINKYLISQGHEVRVMIDKIQPYTFEGVEVVNSEYWGGHYGWADVVMTYLDKEVDAIQMCMKIRKPIFWIGHNTFRRHSVASNRRVNVIMNCHNAAAITKYPNPTFILYPPVDIDHYNVNKNPEKNEYITLININPDKGGHVLHKLARMMPNKKFLGVKGGYGAQVVDNAPENLKIVENTPDIREVYKKTRILIMPSTYESWGRTATEAMANGIPVIANKTFGLEENLGEAGIFCNLNNMEEWKQAIEKLDGKKEYSDISKLCRKRAEELRPTKNLQALEKWMHERAGIPLPTKNEVTLEYGKD